MTKKTSAVLFVIIAFVIIVGITFAMNSSTGTSTPSKTSAGSESINLGMMATTSVPKVSASGTYTLAQVAAHKTPADCWTTINGGVYNVTSWISEHPGGAQAIIGLCGIDGSAAFNGQHGGQARPATELAGFKVGTLTK